MATYTKETALYDTGAIAGDIQEAGTTASSYLTDISGGGVYVHSADTPSDPTSSTAQGVQITDEVNIIRDGESVATFGENARIGSNSSASLYLSDSGIQANSTEGATYFMVNSAGADITQRISDGGNQVQAQGSSYQLTHSYLITDKFAIWSGMPAGTRLYVRPLFTFKARSSGTTPQEMTYTGSFTLSKGTSEDQSFTNSRFDTRYVYNPSTEQITITVSAKGTFSDTYYPYLINYEDFVNVTTYAPTNRFGTNLAFTGQPVSTAFGDGTLPPAYGVSIGKYNEEDTNNDNAFIIGNGADESNRSNAFTVDWDGNVNASGELEVANGAFTVDGSGNVTTDGKYQSLFKITEVTKTISGGINANSYVAAASISMTAQTGYNAVGIVGHSSSNFRVQPTTNYVSSNTSIFAGFANWSASNVTSNVTVVFYVLWLKATSA